MKHSVSLLASLKQVLANLNETGLRACVVCDEEEKTVGFVADYDIRQALLKGVTLETPVSEYMNTSFTFATAQQSQQDYLKLMAEKGIDILPILDDQKRLVELVRLKDIETQNPELKAPIVIMAGGYGKRLMPLTANTPKPLLPIGDKPLLAHTLDHLTEHGFSETYLTTHYLAEQFENFVKDHDYSGLDIQLVHESDPTGTAGSLKQLDFTNQTEPVFVMNGDILTKLDFGAMYKWHHKYENALTVASCYYQHQIPYGVLALSEGQTVTHIDEKPTKAYPVNAGIYLISPECFALIQKIEGKVDMTDLIEITLEQKLRVGNFPLSEYWSDIGRIPDYEEAVKNYGKNYGRRKTDLPLEVLQEAKKQDL